MTDIELYREIGTWLNRYHNRRWRGTGLLKDFQHDLWFILKDKQERTLSYIQKNCWLYPANAVRYKYYKRQADFTSREVVLIDEDQQPLTDFADNSFNPEYEFPPVAKAKRKHHKDTKRLKVTYRNGDHEVYDSAVVLAESLGVHKNSIYSLIRKPPSERFTKRKLSHIKLITYIDELPLQRINEHH